MRTSKLIFPVLVYVLFSISACGGGGGGGGSAAPAATPPPIPDEKIGGIWSGTSTNDQGGDDLDFVGVSTDDGRFRAVTLDTGAQFIGLARTEGSSMSFDGIGVAPDGYTWINGAVVTQITASGQIKERSDISATWRTDSTGESGTLNLVYEDIHQRNSAVNKFAGVWVGEEVALSFDPTGGFSGQDSDNCIYNGSVSVVDPNFNTYELEVNVSQCNFASGNYNGDYVGLGFLVDTENIDGTLNSDEALVLSVDNGIYYLSTFIRKGQ